MKKNIESGKAVLVDTRGAKDWKKGHIKGAWHLPLNRVQKLNKDSKVDLPKDKIIHYTHCQAGVGTRAKLLAERLAKLGYKVRPLKSGYPHLVKAGFSKTK